MFFSVSLGCICRKRRHLSLFIYPSAADLVRSTHPPVNVGLKTVRTNVIKPDFLGSSEFLVVRRCFAYANLAKTDVANDAALWNFTSFCAATPQSVFAKVMHYPFCLNVIWDLIEARTTPQTKTPKPCRMIRLRYRLSPWIQKGASPSAPLRMTRATPRLPRR